MQAGTSNIHINMLSASLCACVLLVCGTSSTVATNNTWTTMCERVGCVKVELAAVVSTGATSKSKGNHSDMRGQPSVMRGAFARHSDARCTFARFDHESVHPPHGWSKALDSIVQVARELSIAVGLPSLGYYHGVARVFAMHLYIRMPTTTDVAMAARHDHVQSKLIAPMLMFATVLMWTAVFAIADRPIPCRARARTKSSCKRSKQHRHHTNKCARKHMRTAKHGRGTVVLDQIADMEDRSRHGSPHRHKVMVSHFH